jgi:hypothetical protein
MCVSAVRFARGYLNLALKKGRTLNCSLESIFKGDAKPFLIN